MLPTCTEKTENHDSFLRGFQVYFNHFWASSLAKVVRIQVLFGGLGVSAKDGSSGI